MEEGKGDGGGLREGEGWEKGWLKWDGIEKMRREGEMKLPDFRRH